MKYIVLFIVSMFLVFACQPADAQDISRTGSTGKSIATYKHKAADTISANQDTVMVEFLLGPDQAQLWDMNVHLDATTVCPSTDSIKVEPFGKIFKSDTYSSIGTAVYYQTSADTTITFQEHTTADYIRWVKLRISYIGSSTGKATIGGDNAVSGDDIEFKGWW